MLKCLNNIHIDESRVLILGFTFKGDCPDVRNTKIIDIVNELQSYNIKVDVHDEWASPIEVQEEFGLILESDLSRHKYDAIILAVDHSLYKEWGESKIRKLGKKRHIIYDLKYVLPIGSSDMRL